MSPLLLIIVLLLYTCVLMLFFMRWCSLVPTMCHPSRQIPLSVVRSPRQNAKITALETISTASRQANFDPEFGALAQTSILTFDGRIYSKLSIEGIKTIDHDRLHPKYSLHYHHLQLLEQQFEEMESQRRKFKLPNNGHFADQMLFNAHVL